MSAIRKRTVRIAARLSTKNKTCPKCGNNDIRPGRRYCWLCGHTFRKRKEDPPVFRPQLPISHPVPDLGDVCEMKTDCAVADFHPTGVGDMVNFDPSKIRTGDPCIMYASAKKGTVGIASGFAGAMIVVRIRDVERLIGFAKRRSAYDG